MNHYDQVIINEELCFNIWFIVDIGSNLSRHCLMKPYTLKGNDDEILEILAKLAESDFLDSERVEFAPNATGKIGDEQLRGVVPANLLRDLFNNNIDIFLSQMEKKLPPLVRHNPKDPLKPTIQKLQFSNSPLFVLTFLYENEFGEMKTATTQENNQWLDAERNRIKNIY